ncbi:conserved hypothetical protein [Solidesulfovibrio fructosivorans JJ]]|uniref:Uncharacterized protein n=1 Tax=Solidesulfovibrio fructosivorans JJ] TaxID=596151 RepID=E1K0N9_SOLFR|nr:hypothetical protein [Solidesulfovibrio fructosivorans]EFL49803.1 conserved hypothetical protein [Solidesulfovibrio fructosivorans JJ]]
MATTSVSTSDVVNWAYQYSLACAKLTSAQSAASSSSNRRADIATAQADFNNTMISLLPTDVQSSVQVQYMQAYTSYNTAMASTTSEAGRQAAMASLYDTLSGITLPTASNATINISNAMANIASMASNAGTAWLAAVASGANIMNTQAASYTESLKTMLSNAGMDTSGITSPTISTQAASTFAAASAAAATGGTSGAILNAALVGYILANDTS